MINNPNNKIWCNGKRRKRKTGKSENREKLENGFYENNLKKPEKVKSWKNRKMDLMGKTWKKTEKEIS